jgi:SAM-dependent methyltransferase
VIADRNTKLTGMLDLARLEGLEIGPLTHPVVGKEQGRIAYADHLSAEGLRVKYAGDASVHPERLVDVDFVTGDGTLTDAVGARRFDYAIASHVIEHVPDLIGFLQELTHVLRPEGFLCLAVPDKRFTFDHFRANTALADLLEAHLAGLRRPSVRQVFDHFANVMLVPARDAWRGALQKQRLVKPHTMADAWRMAEAAASGDRHIDCHCHVFTPTSFFELLRGCFELDLLELRVTHFWSPIPHEVEFFVVLRRPAASATPEAARAARLASLPPLEVSSCLAKAWRPNKGPGLLLGSRAGGFEGRIFFALGAVRYWVPDTHWAREAGFEWPADILWSCDEDIARWRLAPGPPPAPRWVRAQAMEAA